MDMSIQEGMFAPEPAEHVQVQQVQLRANIPSCVSKSLPAYEEFFSATLIKSSLQLKFFLFFFTAYLNSDSSMLIQADIPLHQPGRTGRWKDTIILHDGALKQPNSVLVFRA